MPIFGRAHMNRIMWYPSLNCNFVNAKQVKGVSLGGLITTVQPLASAGATFRVIIAAGKFQGVMIAQTPTGCLTLITIVFAVEEGMVSPYARGASSENQMMKLAAYVISPLASAIILPFSKHSIVATV